MDVGLHLGPIFIDFTLQLATQEAVREPRFSEPCWLLGPRWPQIPPRRLPGAILDRFSPILYRFSMIVLSSWAHVGWIFLAILDILCLIPWLACLLVGLLVVGLFAKQKDKQTKRTTSQQAMKTSKQANKPTSKKLTSKPHR